MLCRSPPVDFTFAFFVGCFRFLVSWLPAPGSLSPSGLVVD